MQNILLWAHLQSLHLGVQLPLAGLQGLVLQGPVRQLLHHVRHVLLSSASLSVRVLQLVLGLLQLVGDGVELPLALDQLLPGPVSLELLLLQAALVLLDVSLVLLDGLLGLEGRRVFII